MSRRFQVKVPYFYCNGKDCTEGTTGYDAEDKGRAHAEKSGHEVRVCYGREVIIRPAQLQAVRP